MCLPVTNNSFVSLLWSVISIGFCLKSLFFIITMDYVRPTDLPIIGIIGSRYLISRMPCWMPCKQHYKALMAVISMYGPEKCIIIQDVSGIYVVVMLFGCLLYQVSFQTLSVRLSYNDIRLFMAIINSMPQQLLNAYPTLQPKNTTSTGLYHEYCWASVV